MRVMGLFETKNRFSELCEQVSSTREPLVVTRHGKALVQIVPMTETASSVWDSVQALEAKYGALQDEIELPTRDIATNRISPLDEDP